MPASANGYTRVVEDVIDGQWRCTKWSVGRKYCKYCKKQYTPDIPGVLPNEHFGNTIMSQIFAMRSINISYGKMQELIRIIYDRHINESTLERICSKVASKLEPLYTDMLKEIPNSRFIYGDETGWYMNGKRYWAWVFLTDDTTLYYFAPSRGQCVAEAILHNFDGIMISDSYSGWNNVGAEHQRCLLHYFRDLYHTVGKNQSEEFKTFFNRLYRILKDAIKLDEKHTTVPDNAIQSLQDKIASLISDTYTDKDCKRYTKRLRREQHQLFTFLKHDIQYHNNLSERALRSIAIMRKTLYGSRSEKGLKTTEILASVYATCKMRDVNPYHFVKDYLNGITDTIPARQTNTITA